MLRPNWRGVIVQDKLEKAIRANPEDRGGQNLSPPRVRRIGLALWLFVTTLNIGASAQDQSAPVEVGGQISGIRAEDDPVPVGADRAAT